MKDGAFFDSFIGVAIGIYFTTHERFLHFHELIVDRLNFEEKIRVLEKLPYNKPYKSIQALPVVRQVQQARNLIAHEYYIDHRHKKLQKAGWLKLFEDYPKSYTKPVMLARQRLSLCVSRLVDRANTPDASRNEQTQRQEFQWGTPARSQHTEIA